MIEFRRGDVVLVSFPFVTPSHAERKRRPALVAKDTPEGREAGLRLDSVVDCQTLATIPRGEIVRRLGRFPPELMRQINDALQDALGLAASSD